MDGPLSIKKTQLQQTTTVQKLNDEGRKQHYVLKTNVYHDFRLRLYLNEEIDDITFISWKVYQDVSHVPRRHIGNKETH